MTLKITVTDVGLELSYQGRMKRKEGKIPGVILKTREEIRRTGLLQSTDEYKIDGYL